MESIIGSRVYLMIEEAVADMEKETYFARWIEQ